MHSSRATVGCRPSAAASADAWASSHGRCCHSSVLSFARRFGGGQRVDERLGPPAHPPELLVPSLQAAASTESGVELAERTG